MAMEVNIRAPPARKATKTPPKGKAASMKMRPEGELSDNDLDESATTDAELRDIDASGPDVSKEGKEPD